MSTLIDLGWTEARAAEFTPHAAAALVPGRVSLEHNHVYRVLSGAGEVLAEASGRVRHEAAGQHALPVVGDWVAMRIGAQESRSQIRAVLRRTSAFSRQAAGRETVEQVLAANIDTVFLVSGLDDEFNLRRVERYVLLARQSGARPVVILNKADMVSDVGAALAEVAALAPDLSVHAISTRSGNGFAAILAYLGRGQTVALLGSSGVGKSSIVNRLLGHDLLKTAVVRESDSRGRHTSVHRQLVPLASGAFVIDTPGIRELQLWDDGGQALGETFADIEAHAPGCRFRDCRHRTEPGCAVKRAVDDGVIAGDRYEHFLKLAEERDVFERKRDERAANDEKRRGKIAGKALRATQRDRE